MKMPLAIAMLMLSGVCSADPRAELRVQSIDCFYAPAAAERQGAVRCTVRLHARVGEGEAFVDPPSGAPLASPLIGRDAAGRLMIGVFRGWESCLERCRTLVYDFYTRPQGGWVEFDTSIDLRLSSGSVRTLPVPFNPTQAAALHVAGMSFFFTPLPTPEGESDPHAVYFRVEYETSPRLKQIAFCNAEGEALHSRVIGGAYSEGQGLTSATYLLSQKGETTCLQLELSEPPGECRVPVRFRAYMGLVTDPGVK